MRPQVVLFLSLLPLLKDISFQSLFEKMNKTSAAGGGEKKGIAGETFGGKRLSLETIYIGSVEALNDVMGMKKSYL